MNPIAIIHSCYPERFGVPRQPGLVPSNMSKITFKKSFDLSCFRGIEDFSHYWVVFLFHGRKNDQWKSVVRPPRLGGKVGKGVFATRSPIRPNPVGLSLVKIEKIIPENSCEVSLLVSGGDFLDGTPVIDIKPYLPYVESVPNAKSAWAVSDEHQMDVEIPEKIPAELPREWRDIFNEEKTVLMETLASDPRPAHERNKDAAPGQRWGVKIGSFDIGWTVEGGKVFVLSAKPLSSNPA